MRIIAGRWKSKELVSPKTTKIRPTLDRIKEALFSIIMPYIENAEVLDLFAGTGNLGIEALSRGASFVHFNDIDPEAIKTIYTNVQLTNYQNYAKITKKDYEKCLKSLKKENKSFDIIFVDPPYNKNEIEKCLKNIENYKVLKADGIIILETDRDKFFEETIEGLKLVNKRTYGRVMLRLYKREE
ncbi:MAG: 16S rRNA (guanine(966)-N(2))-methyltransferase RsmD [Clostridia bacterium]|nr:16S rRNA (guanine(966)-N(2))-methyltransferase RsmD [Clostridia bacterium]MDD4376146.1 16S rRNA (guanine(966)-N(2))-methyltransferase RsmD [Clostridia bacterium]